MASLVGVNSLCNKVYLSLQKMWFSTLPTPCSGVSVECPSQGRFAHVRQFFAEIWRLTTWCGSGAVSSHIWSPCGFSATPTACLVVTDARWVSVISVKVKNPFLRLERNWGYVVSLTFSNTYWHSVGQYHAWCLYLHKRFLAPSLDLELR